MVCAPLPITANMISTRQMVSSTKFYSRHSPNASRARSPKPRVLVNAAAASDLLGSAGFDVKELFRWAAQNGVRGSGLAFATGIRRFKQDVVSKRPYTRHKVFLHRLQSKPVYNS